MKTSIGYLPVRLNRRPGSTQNKVKASPALVTDQIPISKLFLVSFGTHFGRQDPSKTDLESL